MKKILFHLYCLICSMQPFLSGAQPCYNGIRTNPENPFNPEGECGILNAFDWRQVLFTVYPQSGPSFQVPSPYLTHLHFKDQTLSSYLDNDPDDGWELIKAGEQDLPIPRGNYAYFILYNKFGSFLRIFFTLNPSEAGQATNTELFFKSPDISGLLHPTRGINQPLDQRSVEKTKVTVRSNNEFGHFMYVDIPVEYDPCTCMNESLLTIQFWYVLDLYIEQVDRFWGVNRTLAEIYQGVFLSTFEDDYLLKVLHASEFSEAPGTQTFANVQALTKYHQKLKNDHAALKEKYEIALAFEEVVKQVSAIPGPLLRKIQLLDSATILGISGVNYSGKDLISGFLTGYNYYSSRLKREIESAGAKLNRVGGSSITGGEMAFQGLLNTHTQLPDAPFFKTPGSAGTEICGYADLQEYYARVNAYPRYNEVLGRFALLETPVIETKLGLAWPTEYKMLRIQFNPAEFRYSFNPAAGIDLENTEIWAALQFRVENYPLIGHNLREIFISESGDTAILQTPLMPLDCLGEFIAAIDGDPETSSSGSVPMELKLFVDYQFEGGSQALQVYTYPIEEDFEILISPDETTPGWPHEATPYYPDALTLETTHYTADATIFAWSHIIIEGKLTTAPGVKVEIIAPGINVVDGAQVGADIRLHNRFVPFTNCEPIPEFPVANLAAWCSSSTYQANLPALPFSEEEKPAFANLAQMPDDQVSSHSRVTVEVWPNPLEGYGALQIALPEDAEVQAFLSNLSGGRVKELIPLRHLSAGVHLFDLLPDGVPSGVYFITVQTSVGVGTARVVVR